MEPSREHQRSQAPADESERDRLLARCSLCGKSGHSQGGITLGACRNASRGFSADAGSQHLGHDLLERKGPRSSWTERGGKTDVSRDLRLLARSGSADSKDRLLRYLTACDAAV